MTSAYVAIADFKASDPGAQYADLSDANLTLYINRASSAIEQHCTRVFVPAAPTENLLTSGRNRAVIGNDGFLTLYPRLAFPINTVTSITWVLRAPALPNNTSSNSTQTVQSTDIVIETDTYGDGQNILVFEDFSQYRDPGITLQFTLVYTGGYAAYPDWLQQSAIWWTAGLLKERGSGAFAMGGSGEAGMSPADYYDSARDLLHGHVRHF